MIRLGKTYGNLMVDVAAANEKLARRVRDRRGRNRRAAAHVEEALEEAGGSPVAIVSLLAEVDAETARRRLEAVRTEHRGRAGALR